MKFLHVSILAIIFFILGVFVRGLFIQDSVPKEKVVVKVKREEILVKEIESVEFLPKFIKKSLNEMKINDKNLTKKDWDIFLSKVKNEVFDEIKSKKQKDDLLFKLVSEKDFDIDKIAKLVEQGYDINAKNKYDETPLLVALRSISNESDIEKIKKLVQLGANVDIALKLPEEANSHIDVDVLTYALMNTNKKVRDGLINYFESIGKRIEQNPERYVMTAHYNDKYGERIINSIDMSKKLYGDYNAFEELFPMLKNEKISSILDNPDSIDYSKGLNLLHQLPFNANISQENIDRILSLNLDINAKSKETNMTPLQSCIMSENIKLTETYLQHGANPYIKNDSQHNMFELVKKSDLEEKSKQAFLDLLNKYKDNFIQ